jgi:hypothetical protein
VGDPGLSLVEAIKKQFLAGYDPNDRFVKLDSANQRNLGNYQVAKISYPLPPNADLETMTEYQAKCPKNYSETNAPQYFLMNKDVKGKFIFVKIGQDNVTKDGTLENRTAGFYGYGWDYSIRILK